MSEASTSSLLSLIDEYRQINKIQAQIIHESQEKKKPCRDYNNADIDYICRLTKALARACYNLEAMQKWLSDNEEYKEYNDIKEMSSDEWMEWLMNAVE